MTLNELLNAADSITTVGVLLGIIWAFTKGWWVFGREVQNEKETVARLIGERNDWQQIAIKALHIGEQTVDVIRNGKHDR